MICEYFNLDILEAKNKYNCCFTKNDYKTGKYDFYYILGNKFNINKYEELIKIYNVVQITNQGFLVSNEYVLINYEKQQIIVANRTRGRSKILTNKYAIRFITRYQKGTISSNISDFQKKHLDCLLPKIFYFSNTMLIEERIFHTKQYKYRIPKFIFVLYLIYIKRINIIDLDDLNIIYKNKKFYIVDIDCYAKMRKRHLIIHYINQYFIKYNNHRLGKKIDDYLSNKFI